MHQSNKTCTACGETHPANPEHFPPHKLCRGGLNPECRGCHNARIRAWKHKHRERLGARRREIYRDTYGDRQRALERARFETYPLRVQAERLQSGVRERCRLNGWEYLPEFRQKQFFIDWLVRQPSCPCCGVRFHVGPKHASNAIKLDASPSIDRFDLSKPYTLANIELICWRCNNIKRNYSAADLRIVADWMEARTSWGNETTKFAPVASGMERMEG